MEIGSILEILSKMLQKSPEGTDQKWLETTTCRLGKQALLEIFLPVESLEVAFNL